VPINGHVIVDIDGRLLPGGGSKDTWKPGWDALHAKLQKQGTKSTELWIAEGQAHGFFNREPWLTVTQIAADRFLVQQGFLKDQPTLSPPTSGEKLVPAAIPAR
jgi:hypothetical protein